MSGCVCLVFLSRVFCQLQCVGSKLTIKLQASQLDDDEIPDIHVPWLSNATGEYSDTEKDHSTDKGSSFD